MKFAIGYQEPENGDDFLSLVEDYAGDVSEIYFAWPGAASCRPALGKGAASPEETIEALEFNLREMRRLGVKLDLLFNATCYGGKAASKELEREVDDTIRRVVTAAGGLEVVTTSSIAVAWIVKRHFPEIEVRGSVNMRTPSAESMSYLGDLFDSFHIQRDVQRDLALVRETKRWCEANGKRLCLLANSGCLQNCPGQLYHDNLVAHDAECRAAEPLKGFIPHVCWSLLRNPEKRDAFLKGSWLRPEDLLNYEGAVDIVKLATRVHSNPRLVVNAYTLGSFAGNIADLLEPTFSMLFAPAIIANRKFPANWFEVTSHCRKDCQNCSFCRDLLPILLATP